MTRAKRRQILVDHYLDFYSVAVAMLKDEDDAKDVVQEAIVRTLVKVHVKDVFRYCMKSVRNLSVDVLRRKNRMHCLDGMVLVADIDMEEMRRVVNEKKDQLSEVGRALLELHYEEGYTLAEVAAMMQMSLSTMKRILADAKNELKQMLEEEL